MSNLIKKSMRLFGLPYQFTDAVDPRLDGISNSVGNKFLRNMIVEGPVVTLIPGKPYYLPSEDTTDKKVNTTAALLEGASEGFQSLKSSIDASKPEDYRLYDFKRDYTEYMKYVNALCRMGATFLELDAQLDGTPLQEYDWRNYRWDSDSYSSIAQRVGNGAYEKLKKSLSNLTNDVTTKQKAEELNASNYKGSSEYLIKHAEAKAMQATTQALQEQKKAEQVLKSVKKGTKAYKKAQQDLTKANHALSKAKNSGDAILSNSKNIKSKNDQTIENYAKTMENTGLFMMSTTNSEEDETTAELEDMLQNYNYVQFYVDPSSGIGESMSNSTTESQLKGMMEGSSGLMKDLAFMANSGGLDAETLQSYAGELGDKINSGIQQTLGGTTPGAVLSRLINLGNETLKGNNFIMPDIYQSSDYSKSYTLSFHFKTPYGNKLGYYLNVFVPMMHLLAFAIPKQATSNSYSAPFLVRAYIEGCLTCNLGIVTSVDISRVEDSWSIDGLASEVDMSVTIQDLYSDLMMTPSSSPILLVNNASLVEFLATNCGLSLTAPMIGTKAQMLIDVMKNAFKDIKTNIGAYALEKIDNSITSFTGLNF